MPSDHVYLRHLEPVDAARTWARLADPTDPLPPPGAWAPSPILEPAWLEAHAGRFDVVHLHFGFEHRTPDELSSFVGTLRRLGTPLVLTVHDLENPHLADQRHHVATLDVLVPAADVLITLTTGAAAEVARRWGRRPVVLPHPHVVPLARLAADRPARRGPGLAVGTHASGRANDGAAAVRRPLADAVAALPGAHLVAWPDPRPTDDELWDHLAALDVLVLAHRFGTHSGFVEACHDLGTTVIAPRIGHLADQHPVLGYALDDDRSLAAALARADRERPSWRADPAERARQRDALAVAHHRLYVEAVAGRVAA